MDLNSALTDEERQILEENGLLRSKKIMSEVVEIPIGKLRIAPTNVRKDPGDISDLAKSINQVGILEPLLVRPADSEYQVIAGTRRLAAAKQLQLKTVPCIIKDLDDEAAMIVSLTENIQRGNLEEEEIVEAFLILSKMNPSRWTQKEFAKQLGKSNSWVSSYITAYEALQRLRQKGLKVSMKTSPRRAERDKGSIPVGHLQEVEYALRSSDVKETYPEDEELDEKRVELISAVKDMPQEEVKKVVDRFRMYPEKEVKDIVDEVESRRTGVKIGKTYLPPKVARQLDELAVSKRASMEEVLPDVVEQGLRMQSTLQEIEDEDESAEDTAARPEVPLSVQLGEQRKWNLQQLMEIDLSKLQKRMHFDFITIGFSQKTVENMIAALKIVDTKTLVDIRSNPQSRYKQEFNKRNLSTILNQEGIAYKHIADLGIPRHLRNRAYSGEISKEELFRIYDEKILTKELVDSLIAIIESEGGIGLLCTEISPLNCHRHRVALELKKHGYIGYDI